MEASVMMLGQSAADLRGKECPSDEGRVVETRGQAEWARGLSR